MSGFARTSVEDFLIQQNFNVDKTQTSENFSENVVFVLTDNYTPTAAETSIVMRVIFTAAVGHSNELDEITERAWKVLFKQGFIPTDVTFVYGQPPIVGRGGNTAADSAEMSVKVFRRFGGQSDTQS